jgi:hypothetical protein
MSSRRKMRIGLVLIAVLGVAAMPAAAGAAPARYVFEMCDSALPGGGTAGLIYAPDPREPFSAENTCSQPGGALIVRQGDLREGGMAAWGVPMVAAPGTRFESLTISAASCGPPWRVTVFAEGWPSPRCSDDVRTFRLNEEFGGVSVALACVEAFYPCPAGPWVSAHYFAVTVLDPEPPSLAGLQGTLLAPGVRRGRQTIAASARDLGGGVAGLFLAVNGLPAAQPRPQGCNVLRTENSSVAGTVAAQVAPCPAEARASWTLDTGSYPFRDGANRVQVCASDFATLDDPNIACSAAQTVEIDNSCSESPVAGGEVLSAQFSGSHDDTTTVRYGRGAEIEGRLTTDAGDPVRGAVLCVMAQTIAVDSRLAPAGSVLTDASGGYRYKLAPGPNRELMIGYRHDTEQVARDVRFYAHVRPTLKLAPSLVRNGERVRLWGSLPGPRAGRRVVVLQANAPGSKRWITFRRATTDSEGGFRSGYRFSSTSRRTRYRFRALVPRQAGYPWIEGHSRPVAVVVEG